LEDPSECLEVREFREEVQDGSTALLPDNDGHECVAEYNNGE
jgi:hypothetical protein